MPVWRRLFSVFPTGVGVILFGAYQFDYPLFPNMSLLGTSQATIFGISHTCGSIILPQ